MTEIELTIEEFESAFKRLKMNKANCFDDVSSDIVKAVQKELTEPIFQICKKSIRSGIFTDKMKIAKITPLFKSDVAYILKNYGPISVLIEFTLMLSKITCYITNNLISDTIVLQIYNPGQKIWPKLRKTALYLKPQAMYNHFKRPSAGSVSELYYIYRKT